MLFYAATLNNMAGTYRQMQDYDRAIDLYLKARKLYHNICGRTIAPYIGSLNNLSLAYRIGGRNIVDYNNMQVSDLIPVLEEISDPLGASLARQILSGLGPWCG